MPDPILMPDSTADTKALFDVNVPFDVPAFSDASLVEHTDYIPRRDEAYAFDTAATRAILAGFALDRRVLLHGFHGTGKSSHIEQIASRLNWPLLRINLDGHLTRMDLMGRDAIVLEEGKQITTFKEGLLPWAMEHGVALVFDEYDAARPEVLFVLQRLLEAEGRLTLPEQNRVIDPHPAFRLFATANTIGMGDVTGMYHGTHPINQGQMDRWNIVLQLDYPSAEVELQILLAKVPELDKARAQHMVAFAGLVREAFAAGDVSSTMSPRTLIALAQNTLTFGDLREGLALAFLNKCDSSEHGTLDELYQRAFGDVVSS